MSAKPDDTTSRYTTDGRGNRVLRGLTVTETRELERMRDGIGFDRDRYFDLSWEHEIAQLAVGPHE